MNYIKRYEGLQTAKDGEELINAAKVEENSDDEDSKIEEV